MSLEDAGPLILVGGGKMGEALLGGWTAAGLPVASTWVVEPEATRRAHLVEQFRIRAVAVAADLPSALEPSALVLAVKPQVMADAIAGLRVAGDTLILSIAAGKPLAGFERAFGPDRPIVRAMPNTPAAVRRGVTVLCANQACGDGHRALAQSLMMSVGEVFWVEDEELMHAVTAVSGSGPAYVFLLIEALADAGSTAGLPQGLATALAKGTVAGAAELAHTSAATAVQLRANVTSPGGTTAAALAVLTAEDGLSGLLQRAIAAAAGRSRELA